MQLMQRGARAGTSRRRLRRRWRDWRASRNGWCRSRIWRGRSWRTLGVQRGQVAMTFGDVTERLKGLEAEIGELRLKIEAQRAQESQTKRRGDQLRGEARGAGRTAEFAGWTDSRAQLLDRYGAEHLQGEPTSGAANGLPPVGTLADFLEVDGQYEGVVDEFLRDELNYVVVKSWDAADAGMRMLQTDVAGRATFLVHGDDAQANFAFAEGMKSAAQTNIEGIEGVVALKDCVRVLNGFGKSLEGMLPKLRDGFIAQDRRRRGGWRVDIRMDSFWLRAARRSITRR